MKIVHILILMIVLFSLVQAEDFSTGQKMTFDRQTLACEQGEPFSCLRLGDYYYLGRGVAKNISTAEDLYAKGAALMKEKCDQGVISHCTYYAGMLQAGKGVAVNVEMAYQMYHDLCNKGDCESCGRLYYLNSQGLIFSDSQLIMCSEPVYIY